MPDDDLEHVPADCAVEIRVFGTYAKADADATPPRSGLEVVRVVTGVSRAEDSGV
jgi:hypothetical protein